MIDDSKQDKLKDFMRRDGVAEIRKRFETYVKLLKEEFSQGLILPTKDTNGVKSINGTVKQGTQSTVNNTTTAAASTTSTTTTSKDPLATACKIETSKLVLNEEFKCRAHELYQVFTDINMVRAYTQNPNVVYEAEKHGRFSLFDGNISGSFVEFVPNKKIVMNWRYKQWPASNGYGNDYYSLATIEFTEKEDCTLLTLTQTGVPKNFVENTEEGWKRFYWSAIKQTFGFGSRLC